MGLFRGGARKTDGLLKYSPSIEFLEELVGIIRHKLRDQPDKLKQFDDKLSGTHPELINKIQKRVDKRTKGEGSHRTWLLRWGFISCALLTNIWEKLGMVQSEVTVFMPSFQDSTSYLVYPGLRSLPLAPTWAVLWWPFRPLLEALFRPERPP